MIEVSLSVVCIYSLVDENFAELCNQVLYGSSMHAQLLFIHLVYTIKVPTHDRPINSKICMTVSLFKLLS